MATCPAVFDALIVGAGPAGLAAALALGRVMRTAAIFDTGVFRNAKAEHMHTVPTWDHHNPAVYRQKSIAELRDRYSGTIHFTDTGVTSISRLENKHFRATDQQGKSWTGRKVVLATGVKDVLPDIPGYSEAWGQNIFHCLFCHGFEERQSKAAGILVLDKANLPAEVQAATHNSPLAKRFAERITVFLDGNTELLEDASIKKLQQQGFAINSKPIAKIVPLRKTDDEGGPAVNVELQDGSVEEMAFLVHRPRTVLAHDFAATLGLELTEAGDIQTKPPFYETSVEGVFAAGDCAVMMKQVLWAAATGATAGAGLNFQLLREETEERERSSEASSPSLS